jgi:hypothetical protein
VAPQFQVRQVKTTTTFKKKNKKKKKKMTGGGGGIEDETVGRFEISDVK